MDIKPEIQYVSAALSIMQEQSLCASNILDWKQFREEIFFQANSCKSISEAHTVIRTALAKLSDKHSFLITPENHQATYDNPAPPLPSGEFVHGIAYLQIPHYVRTRKLDYTGYADQIQKIISELDKEQPKGWVVDLRKNGGGDMWPMIAGLGPLLGEGVLGHLKYFNGPMSGNFSYSYRAGTSLWDDKAINAQVSSTPYHLENEGRPIAILVSERTASSAEAVLIGFIGNPNACIFGMPTAGLSTGNSPFDLPDGSKLYVTTGVFTDRTGKEYGRPIIPDVMVPMSASSSELINDPAFLKAHEWITANAPLTPLPRQNLKRSIAGNSVAKSSQAIL